jgi:hypothetical protein
MKKRGIVSRFYEYQKERFPFLVLIFTTTSVVLSSMAIVHGYGFDVLNNLKNILIGVITCLLFMFSIRVFDEFKDNKFDRKYHSERPVQRGLISLSELNRINLIFLIFQGILNLFHALIPFFYWLLALIYSLVARAEFFIKKFIRRRFILYNALNLLQIFFLQIYLYALIEPNFSWQNPLLLAHFIFVLTNAAILEIARKLKPEDYKNPGKDTYSGRYGINKAVTIYTLVYGITYFLFTTMVFKIANSISALLISFIPLGLIILSTSLYCIKPTKINSKLVETIAILFYLSMHLLLVWAVI